MKNLLLLILTITLAIVLPAPASNAADGVRESVDLHAYLEGQKPAFGEVFYSQRGAQRIIKVHVQDMHESSASVVLGGVEFRLPMDSVSGRGLLVLDSADGQRVPKLAPKDGVQVNANGRAMLRGQMGFVR